MTAFAPTATRSISRSAADVQGRGRAPTAAAMWYLRPMVGTGKHLRIRLAAAPRGDELIPTAVEAERTRADAAEAERVRAVARADERADAEHERADAERAARERAEAEAEQAKAELAQLRAQLAEKAPAKRRR
jgi:hypothetical protein